jgi:uncharacterized protein (DUF885 family)
VSWTNIPGLDSEAWDVCYKGGIRIYTHPMRSAISYALRFPLARASLSLAVGMLWFVPGVVGAQSFKTRDLAAAPQPNSLEARTQSLHEIFRDYWQERLKLSPELASAIGDKRYDDQLSDYSPQAYNDSLARGERYIERLGAVDTTGMSSEDVKNKQLLVNALVDQQEASVCKPWQTPVTQSYGIQIDLPELVESLTFASSDDYDHYVVRLNKVPAAILQISTDMMLGQQAGHSEPQAVMQKVLAQVDALVSAKPEDTPFARPLEHFPSGISAQQQAEIRTAVLTAIRTKVQPAYTRFARYLTTEYIPNASKEPGSSASMDGPACVSPEQAFTSRILGLRVKAQKALGNNFDLHAFHDEVLGAGAVPLDLLQQRVEAWIQQQKDQVNKK